MGRHHSRTSTHHEKQNRAQQFQQQLQLEDDELDAEFSLISPSRLQEDISKAQYAEIMDKRNTLSEKPSHSATSTIKEKSHSFMENLRHKYHDWKSRYRQH